MSGYRQYAGLKGTKEIHVGHDASAYEFQTIAAAYEAAQVGDTLILAPGTHTLTSKITITKPIRMVGLGQPLVTASAAVTGDMFAIELSAQAAASVVSFEGIDFLHGTDNVDVFDVNNTSVAQTLSVKFKDCSIKVLDEASTGNAIDFNHATAAKVMHLELVGSRANTINCVDIVPGNAGDTVVVDGVYMSENGNASAIIASAADKASLTRLLQVSFKTATRAVTGGHASQTIVASGCLTESVGAALVTGDLAGSQTETLVSP